MGSYMIGKIIFRAEPSRESLRKIIDKAGIKLMRDCGHNCYFDLGYLGYAEPIDIKKILKKYFSKKIISFQVLYLCDLEENWEDVI